jgi:hypothetical protein
MGMIPSNFLKEKIMEYQNVEFKIALNNEEKLKGNSLDVAFRVDFTGVDETLVRKYALKSYIIEVQSQIRNNWDTFQKDGIPNDIKFGNPVLGKKKSVKLTDEEILEKSKKLFEGMSKEEILKFLGK